MAEELVTTDRLRALFQTYGLNSDLIDRANDLVTKINRTNAEAGGRGKDEVGKQYFAVIDPGMKELTQLLTLLADLVQRTGTAGGDVTALLTRAEEEAMELADSWKSGGE
ncbi:hypothetical protein AB0E75_10550 [Streptomyces griseoviridis]|uniref:Uncharacterized protein n=3 Tax=Streptomyces TaxID=1883 RepID=A0A918GJ35_STRGD|nr:MULTISPECIES: hypothetical protein [Streptomyces]MDP9685223.1 hypothetical protein [Streptomyces griseoviridis]GGS41738.1 hypothetical protein GCM10010238_34160 [Streptomyces niveoruber]GGS95665.1 hypothetical protein GCM10010240_31240 [Streptomyces griseoviridis]GGU31981.1 hypothetical protein GCM10010259_23110 [Streptomyces daghestanicus]GHI32823.1 hypothetical protein Sdagh_45530 [Streptomyces daghestanicus]